jgi:hypothetical protein
MNSTTNRSLMGAGIARVRWPGYHPRSWAVGCLAWPRDRCDLPAQLGAEGGREPGRFGCADRWADDLRSAYDMR